MRHENLTNYVNGRIRLNKSMRRSFEKLRQITQSGRPIGLAEQPINHCSMPTDDADSRSPTSSATIHPCTPSHPRSYGEQRTCNKPHHTKLISNNWKPAARIDRSTHVRPRRRETVIARVHGRRWDCSSLEHIGEVSATNAGSKERRRETARVSWQRREIDKLGGRLYISTL